MKTIKVAAPAKINLTLEIVNKRQDGFHNLKTVMQAINLYDYLTVTMDDSAELAFCLSGNSEQIPYDERNLVYKACSKFFEKTGIDKKKVCIYIEKNIPVEAGLAGGSTDAAATFFALNNLCENVLPENEIDELCASLGSDLNFCYYGGTALCTSRGEKIKKLPTPKLDVTLVKPLGFGISAKEAYTKYSNLPEEKKVFKDYSAKLVESLPEKVGYSSLFNILELSVIDDYKDLQFIKENMPESMMSGSGPTFFTLKSKSCYNFNPEKFIVIEGLSTVEDGIKIV